MDQRTAQTASSFPILKWSSKPVDKAARVRDNQRRHREKVRNYIAQLESRLTESQTKLLQAEMTIKVLTEKLDMALGALDPIAQRDGGPSNGDKAIVEPCDANHQQSPLSPYRPTSGIASGPMNE
ncbi:hypothetical protein E5D57_007680 [Metarhizium anisopliae]|nr:hypothetical protein E5D57_007680 [Metarhizium anisopliae]